MNIRIGLAAASAAALAAVTLAPAASAHASADGIIDFCAIGLPAAIGIPQRIVTRQLDEIGLMHFPCRRLREIIGNHSIIFNHQLAFLSCCLYSFDTVK